MKTTFLSSLSFFIFFIVTPSFLLYNLFHDEMNCSELHTYKISNPLNRILNCLIWMVQDLVVDAVNQITIGWAQSTFVLRYYGVLKKQVQTHNPSTCCTAIQSVGFNSRDTVNPLTKCTSVKDILEAWYSCRALSFWWAWFLVRDGTDGWNLGLHVHTKHWGCYAWFLGMSIM